ncbi:MAG TPA: hypothetical protein VFC85_03905 [Verrucomicrobiae bacterium]|nr:hypothetical protein [Verrucomicrobiae bacterium]
MKTPRDILFARHENVEPKLDAIRLSVARELNNKETREQSFQEFFASLFLGCSKNFWDELIFPCRRIWTGLAAIWILIFVVNLSQRDPAEMMARKSPPPSPEMIMAFRQQEKLLAELIGSNEPRIAEPPKTFSPRPSSERRFETLMT